MKSHFLAGALVVALAGCSASTSAPSTTSAGPTAPGVAVREVSLKLPGMT